MANKGQFTIVLVRHGETEENCKAIIQGQLDTKLNDIGILQAKQLAANLNCCSFDKIFASDLSRAFDTCAILANQNGVDTKTIMTDVLLRERRFGVLQGKPLQLLIDLAKQANVPVVDYVADDGESASDVRKRSIEFITKRLLPNVNDREYILLVSHGGVIRELIGYFANYGKLDPKSARIPPNTSVSEFNITFDSNEIVDVECVRLHDIEHLNDNTRKNALQQKQVNNIVPAV